MVDGTHCLSMSKKTTLKVNDNVISQHGRCKSLAIIDENKPNKKFVTMIFSNMVEGNHWPSMMKINKIKVCEYFIFQHGRFKSLAINV